MKSPVALFVFRRPDTTARVLDAIRRARPSLLLVVADGPRPDRPDDDAACAATRALIDGVDWPCDVRRDFAAGNMGCRRRLASGLAWVFAQVPEAIILEDDCVPDQSFFPFCEELLERYRDDHRVAQISGANNQRGRRRGAHSYFFSRFNNVWGWASWRRAFALYDPDIIRWPDLRDSGWLESVLDDRRQVRYWTKVFQDTFEGHIDTWDYQWIFSTWLHGMLSLVPNRNLVRNIGFGSGATNTPVHDPFANDRLETMAFPLDHAPAVVRDERADRFTARLEFDEPLSLRARKALKRRLVEPLRHRIRLLFNIPLRLRFPSFTIDLPPEHLLPAYQQAFPRYDRFLPHLASHLGAGDVVFDVGANCGDTLAAMCSVNPALVFVCVEPDVRFFSYLARNARRIEAAFPGASIRLVRSLVGGQPATATLSGNGGTKTARRIDQATVPADAKGDVHRTVRLDAIAGAQPGLAPARFRLLKSDVDGYDFDVIDSAGAMLDNERLLLFFECFAETDEQRAGYLGLFTRLAARGYRHFALFDNLGNVLQPDVTDVGAIQQLLTGIWDKARERSRQPVAYLDVLAYRDADAGLMERVVAGYQRS